MSRVDRPVSFDSVAPAYTFLERLAFGRALYHARLTHLSQFVNQLEINGKNPSADRVRVLLLGEGAGHFLSALSLRASVPLQIDVCDTSHKMLDLARARLARLENHRHTITFIHGDFRYAKLGERSYRAVSSHFFFDMFDEMGQLEVIQQVTPAIQPGGLWLWSDFNLPERAFPKWRAQVWLSIMYGFFNYTSGLQARRLIDPAPQFAALHWRPVRQAQMNAGFIRSELWQRAQPN